MNLRMSQVLQVLSLKKMFDTSVILFLHTICDINLAQTLWTLVY